MSVHRKNGRWVTRWRDGHRQRSRSFPTKREATDFDRHRRADVLREGIIKPEGAVSMHSANGITSFLVCEEVDDRDTAYDGRSAQRQIHEGYFATIRQAEAYRGQMPDADDLTIVLVYKRFPLRDLTEDEIAAGKVGPDEHDDLRRRIDEGLADKERS